MFMGSIFPVLSAAFMLGLASGLSPGPLLALVVSESLQRGFRSGAAVSMSPLITDVPIILAMTVLAGALHSFDRIIGWLYLAGACYLIFLSVEAFRFRDRDADIVLNPRRSLLKGAVTNLLNPAPYVFWLTVGAPLLVQAKNRSIGTVFAFLGIFYGTLVGSKLLLAGLVGKNRHVLSGRAYRLAMRFLGACLLFFALFFAKSGLDALSRGAG
jgi:threonine/homoserine/homoserine lactone efflux protein